MRRWRGRGGRSLGWVFRRRRTLLDARAARGLDELAGFFGRDVAFEGEPADQPVGKEGVEHVEE